jgi:hypothetical protein
MSIFNHTTISHTKSKLILLAPALITLLLSGCFHDDDDNVKEVEPPVVVVPAPTEYSYQIMITNLTNAQPLSPLGVVLHGDSPMWSVGTSASIALEKLAEGGDNTDFLASDGVISSISSDGVILPGTKAMVSLSTTDVMATHLSLATMLVNTNDAFSGLTNLALSNLVVDQAQTWTLPAYDAGTEKNTESVGTIPGPADGGTGFDAMRDDVDFVAMHSGVVSQDDGLTNSVLSQAHRFDNPSIKITITRTK